MTRLKDIPQLQADGRNLKEVAEAVREVLQTFRGYRGDKRDRALTLRDLDAATLRDIGAPEWLYEPYDDRSLQAWAMLQR